MPRKPKQPKIEDSPEFKEMQAEMNRIRNRARWNPEWRKLLDRINHFANISRRTQPNAIYYLIEKGLELMEGEENERL